MTIYINIDNRERANVIVNIAANKLAVRFSGKKLKVIPKIPDNAAIITRIQKILSFKYFFIL